MRCRPFLAFAGLACLMLATFPAGAARPPLSPSADGEKFLFIVETSSDMEKIQAGTEAALYELIATGIYGQMMPGDTYGVWTFNKQVQAGRFPMQVWDGKRSAQQAAIAAAFVAGQTFEGSAEMKLVMEKLQGVVHAVSNLNVFIISDGDAAIRGTPFDKAISAEYKKRGRERRSAKRPFVTTLVAREGWFIKHSVNIAGDPIKLPERPTPPTPAKTPGQALPAKTSLPVASAPSAAVSLPVQPRTSSPVVPGPASEPLNLTNKTAGQSQPIPPSVAGTDPGASGSAPPAPRKGVIQIITQSNLLVATQPPETSPRVKTNEPAGLPSAPVSGSNSLPDVALTVVSTNAPAPAVAATETVPLPATNQTPPAPSALDVILPPPLVVAARETHPTPDMVEDVAPTRSLPVAAVHVQSATGGTWLLVFGGLLLASALFLLFVGLRRSRPVVGESLITQSMNRR